MNLDSLLRFDECSNLLCNLDHSRSGRAGGYGLLDRPLAHLQRRNGLLGELYAVFLGVLQLGGV